MSTVEETKYVYELAKDLMAEREKDYKGSYKEEAQSKGIDLAATDQLDNPEKVPDNEFK